MILFVVEGSSREKKYFSNISSVFFNAKNKILTIFAPAEMNIYMLFCKLKEDNFETDIVEIIRECSNEAAESLQNYSRKDFSEVYFFFDFDEHGNNIPDKYNISNAEALNEMLQYLDNETETGKLYISYPMVEATRDYYDEICETSSGSCFRNRIDFGTYKHDSSAEAKNVDVFNYSFTDWSIVLFIFVSRICCLFSANIADREKYLKTVNPISIFEKEMITYEGKAEIFILSALPEFLLDYFAPLWNKILGRRKNIPLNERCSKNCDNIIVKD